jgi:beta-galactosidase
MGTNASMTITLPRQETITGLSIVPNADYNMIDKLRLAFDNDSAPVELTIAPTNDRQDFDLTPHTARTLTISVADVHRVKGAITGIDNLWLRVARDETFTRKVKPLANIGGLVKYPIGAGGVILNQLRFQEHEAVPINAQKKQVITTTLLKNMGAQFSGGEAGASTFTYTTVPLDALCNLYLTSDKGWYDSARDLRRLPLDEQTFNNVVFNIRNVTTSPLESAVTLRGPGPNGRTAPETVTGIPVQRKADALFFLHTFIRTREWQPRDARSQPPVVFQYSVNYADGTHTNIAVRYGDGVDHWLQDDPQGLRNAALAWSAAFQDAPQGPCATVYLMRWDNPTPNVAISSIDLAYDRDRYGAPVLLGVTAGTAIP